MSARDRLGGDKLNRVQRLLDALRDDRSSVTLDVAALELASIEFPGLDMEASFFRLNNLAEQVSSQLAHKATGLDFISACNELLFEVLQFRGNEEDYYDPRNSCLNSVLMRRLGIPISLSVVYIEVARRLNRPVYGVGLTRPLHRCLSGFGIPLFPRPISSGQDHVDG